MYNFWYRHSNFPLYADDFFLNKFQEKWHIPLFKTSLLDSLNRPGIPVDGLSPILFAKNI
jgi:hypothetical protein